MYKELTDQRVLGEEANTPGGLINRPLSDHGGQLRSGRGGGAIGPRITVSVREIVMTPQPVARAGRRKAPDVSKKYAGRATATDLPFGLQAVAAGELSTLHESGPPDPLTRHTIED